MLKVVFGVAEYQEKYSYGLGYISTLTRNKDDEVLSKAPGNADAWNKIDNIHWYVPNFTPSISQQSISSKQILIRTPDKFNHLFLWKKWKIRI